MDTCGCNNNQPAVSLLLLLLGSTTGLYAESPYELTFSTFFGGKVDWGIVKLSPTGALLAGTLLGGGAGDNPDGIRIDPQGNLVLFGQTGSADFPVSQDAFQPIKAAGNDAVMVKLSPNLDRIRYSTFLGGSSDDNGRAGCVGRDGSLIVAGTTSGGSWPTPSAFQHTSRGPGDALLAKLSFRPPMSK